VQRGFPCVGWLRNWRGAASAAGPEGIRAGAGEEDDGERGCTYDADGRVAASSLRVAGTGAGKPSWMPRPPMPARQLRAALEGWFGRLPERRRAQRVSQSFNCGFRPS
jgi:hypothetical protein